MVQVTFISRPTYMRNWSKIGRRESQLLLIWYGMTHQRAHTTLQPASSHHSMTSELTPLYDQRAHTTLRPTNSHHSTTSELKPVNSHHSTTLTLTTTYAFTLTRHGLPGCLTTLAYTDSVSPLKSLNLSTAYANPHTHIHTHTHTCTHTQYFEKPDPVCQGMGATLDALCPQCNHPLAMKALTEH